MKKQDGIHNPTELFESQLCREGNRSLNNELNQEEKQSSFSTTQDYTSRSSSEDHTGLHEQSSIISSHARDDFSNLDFSQTELSSEHSSVSISDDSDEAYYIFGDEIVIMPMGQSATPLAPSLSVNNNERVDNTNVPENIEDNDDDDSSETTAVVMMATRAFLPADFLQQNHIPHAIRVTHSWGKTPVSRRFPRFTYCHLVSICLICSLCLVVGMLVFFLSRSSELSNSKTNEPSSVPSNPPSITTTAWEWDNGTYFNINSEKDDFNMLMGYHVSISSDGGTLAVGGHETLQLYTYSQMPNGWNWTKTWDWNDFDSLYETIGDLSWATTVSLSPNGQHLVVGDANANQLGNRLAKGAIFVFSTSSNDQDSQWFQVGSTIFGEFGDNFGNHVAITDIGRRIASNTKGDIDGYTHIYDFDGSRWVLKFEILDHLFLRDITMSADGRFLAIEDAFHKAVRVYELITFTPFQILMSEDDLSTSSASFSHDGKFLAIGIWEANKVYLYQWSTDDKKFLPFSSPIVIPDVEGLGYSVSLSDKGTSLAVGAVSPPTFQMMSVGWIMSDDYVSWTDNVSERGSVFVFKIHDSSWEQVKEFVPNVTRYDKIGWSVSLSANGKVLACGGYGTGGDHGDGPNKNGQVAVYRDLPVL